MIAALAKAGQIYNDPAYTLAAQKAADFILAEMMEEDGRLFHRYLEGEADLPANVDDYAFLSWEAD